MVVGKVNRQNNNCHDIFKNAEVYVGNVKTRMQSKKTNQKFFKDKRIKRNIDI